MGDDVHNEKKKKKKTIDTSFLHLRLELFVVQYEEIISIDGLPLGNMNTNMWLRVAGKLPSVPLTVVVFPLDTFSIHLSSANLILFIQKESRGPRQ